MIIGEKRRENMEFTLTQELFAREYAHKFSILGAYLIETEVKTQTSGDVNLPKFMAEEQALKHVTDTIQVYLSKGVFEEEYEKAWECLKDRLPDGFNASGKCII